MSSVILSSWGMIFQNLDDEEIINSAFNDEDVVFKKGSKEYINTLSFKENKMIPPHAMMGILAVEEAWKKAQLGEERNLLTGNELKFRNPRAGVVSGTCYGALGEISLDRKFDLYSPSKFRGNALAAPIAIRFGLGGADFSLCASSATGGEAIWLASQLIRMDILDLVVVVCSEKINDFTNQLAMAMGVKSQTGRGRPLTAQRDGMRTVEASVAIIFESEQHAKKRNFKGLVRWVNGCVKNECCHLFSPEKTMNALEEAFCATLYLPGLNPNQIDWLSLHATGTRVWDPLEINLVKKIYPEKIPYLTAFKRSFGHGRANACLMATAMIAEGLKNQRLPVLPQDIDPDFNLDISLIKHKPPQLAMHWSAGMGGTIAVNLFKTLND